MRNFRAHGESFSVLSLDKQCLEAKLEKQGCQLIQMPLKMLSVSYYLVIRKFYFAKHVRSIQFH
ncbi:hypothetical protein NQ314_019412 [Rhamnusium bicolor]|uniref:Uncharacterized protein n=1 Tax=Rhamnusium bicolor TaxID=1586634 RepID=A0AAV8WP71_9CUCU|nr:hypothetical protein NQ314_019412 [Rhamnusium bicolor]